MTFTTTKHPMRRLTAAISAGVLALGLSGAVFAHGSGHGDRGYRSDSGSVVINHNYYDEGRGHGRRHHRRHRHGHGKGHYRKHHRRGHGHSRRKVVHVYNHYDAPVEVVHERTRVVERRAPEYHYDRGPSRRHNQINAGSLVGAAIGGLLGAQVGKGSGQLAATAAGTVGGFLLGDHSGRGYR